MIVDLCLPPSIEVENIEPWEMTVKSSKSGEYLKPPVAYIAHIASRTRLLTMLMNPRQLRFKKKNFGFRSGSIIQANLTILFANYHHRKRKNQGYPQKNHELILYPKL